MIVSSFRDKLHHVCNLACESLSNAQGKMKNNYDKNSKVHLFLPGDRVLVVLPVLGSALQAKSSGPYVVNQKLSETDYVILTPNCKKKQHVCHVNMIKSCVEQGKPTVSLIKPSPVAATSPAYRASDDELDDRRSSASCACLGNPGILENLDAHLSHLSPVAKSNICELIHSYPFLLPTLLLKSMFCHMTSMWGKTLPLSNMLTGSHQQNMRPYTSSSTVWQFQVVAPETCLHS